MKKYDNEIANVLAMLHPATLPMLKGMFQDFRNDAEDDGDMELIARADRAIEAVDMLIADN
jgi:hypothetical protein